MLRILIVDDIPQKYTFFDSTLVNSITDQDHIDICTNKKDALTNLGRIQYDVLIVDMAIPETPWTQNIHKFGGIELLRHLQEDGDLKCPAFIIGLTASVDPEPEVASFFSIAPWILMYIGASGVDWQARIIQVLSHAALVKRQEATAKYNIDVCIVTALAVPEQSALFATNILWELDPEYLDSNTLIRRGTLTEITGGKLSIVAACALRMGSVEAGLLSAKLIDRFRPRILTMTGICAGMPDKVGYGDPILATPVWDWTSSKWETGENGEEVVLPAPHYLECAPEIVSRFHLLAQDHSFLKNVRENWPESKPPIPIGAHYGPVASGPILVADGKTLKDIKAKQNRQVLGLEMEAYGVYAAAQNAGVPRPMFFSIKSVCDFADPRKNDEMQRYAAYTSATLLHQFLYRFGKDICAFARD